MWATVSVVGSTVVGMSTHVCTYFDDGDGIELVCVCGTRAVLIRMTDGETELVVLDEDAPALSKTA